MAIHRGRFSAQIDGPFVVFVIGMRINQLWKFWKWIPVSREMGPMVKELFAHPEKGMLAANTFINWRTIMLVQYWRSFDHLEKFSRSSDDPHFEAWKRFNRRVGNNSSVGIWHETYSIPAGAYEAIYVNMPTIGLGQAGTLVPSTGRLENARARISGSDVPSALEPPPQP